jgi:arylsulfatase A-like enzyme
MAGVTAGVTKRRRLVGAAVAAGALAFAASACRSDGSGLHATGSAPRDAANVLLIVTDDQRADTMGVMPKTRRWLARGGVSFPEAFDTTPLCCPSRSTILTGRYAHNHGVLTNGPGDWRHLDQQTTVERVLQQHGYLTAIFGKYLNFWPIRRAPPYFTRYAVKHDNSAYHGSLWNLNGTVERVQRYSTSVVRDRALEFLQGAEADDAAPWFLYLAPNAPHGPFTPAQRYAHATVPRWHPGPAVDERDRSDKPAYVRESRPDPRIPQIREDSLRTLMSVDDMVAAVMRELETLGELQRTLVIFTSDNGVFWNEHDLQRKGGPYTEGVQAPLFLRFPGHAAAGTVDGRLAANVDIAPTILQAAGLQASWPLDGRSLLGPATRRTVLLEYWPPRPTDPPQWASLRTRSYQYIEYYAKNGRRIIAREYYDLRSDPAELTNLLGDRSTADDPASLPRLHGALAAARACAGARCP